MLAVQPQPQVRQGQVQGARIIPISLYAHPISLHLLDNNWEPQMFSTSVILPLHNGLWKELYIMWPSEMDFIRSA